MHLFPSGHHVPSRKTRIRLAAASVALSLAVPLSAAAPSAAAGPVWVWTDGSAAAAGSACGSSDVVPVSSSTSAVFAAAFASSPTVSVCAGVFTFDAPVTLTGPVSVTGAGADVTVLNGSGAGRLFDVAGSASFEGVTLAAGAADQGGAVRVSSDVTLRGVRFTANTAQVGGALYAGGTVTVDASTFDANTATGSGGAVFSAGPVVATNATFAGNVASSGSALDAASATLRYVTALGSLDGSLIAAATVDHAASLLINGAPNCAAASVVDSGVSVITDMSCVSTGGFVFFGSYHGVPESSVALGSLGMHGGTTPTLVPGPTSTALSSVPCFLVSSSVDQRGVARPAGDGCDAGAVEAYAEVALAGSGSWKVPAGITSVDVLVVGGGAGAGSTPGKGAEVLVCPAVPVSPGEFLAFSAGVGGAGSSDAFVGADGAPSTLTASTQSCTAAGGAGAGSGSSGVVPTGGLFVDVRDRFAADGAAEVGVAASGAATGDGGAAPGGAGADGVVVVRYGSVPAMPERYPSSVTAAVSAASVPLGSTVDDVATLTRTFPTGSVPVLDGSTSGELEFFYCYRAVSAAPLTTVDCAESDWVFISRVNVDTQSQALLDNWLPARGVGFYLLQARFAGDLQFEPSVDDGTNQAFEVTKIPATLTYTGSRDLFNAGSTFTASSTLAPTLCTGPVSYVLEPSPTGGASLTLTAGSWPTSNWAGGVYEITALYPGSASCTSAFDLATLTVTSVVTSTGQVSTGGGIYVTGTGSRVNFGYTVNRTTKVDKVAGTTTTSFRGQMLWLASPKWRLKGTVSSTTVTSTATGALVSGDVPAFRTLTCPSTVGATGSNPKCATLRFTGVLQYRTEVGGPWFTATWAGNNGVVSATATVYDGGSVKVCVKKSCSITDVADWFGMSIAGVSASSGVPVTAPMKLQKSRNGAIVIRV